MQASVPDTGPGRLDGGSGGHFGYLTVFYRLGPGRAIKYGAKGLAGSTPARPSSDECG